MTQDRYTVTMTRKTTPDMVRDKIEARLIKGDCWIWQGSVDTTGYGLIRIGGSLKKVHRAYLSALGHDIDGKEVDHLCRVHRCCRPDHLELVTHRENVLRGIGPTAVNAAKTECVNGHEYTPENTFLRANGRGRDCRICRRDRLKRYRAAGRVR